MNAKPEMKKKMGKSEMPRGLEEGTAASAGSGGRRGALRGGRGAPLPCDHAGVTLPWVWGHAPEFGARDFSNP